MGEVNERVFLHKVVMGVKTPMTPSSRAFMVKQNIDSMSPQITEQSCTTHQFTKVFVRLMRTITGTKTARNTQTM